MSHELSIAPERLAAWLTGFERRNGRIERLARAEHHLRATTARGAVLDIATNAPAPSTADRLADVLLPRVSIVVVLVRRGGFAIARATGEGALHAVEASKTGTRYVQGRTAAGGQSQQRFARRRANQAAALVADAIACARRVLGDQPGPCDLLVTGGDHTLVRHVLDSPSLRALTAREQRTVTVGDPRRATVDDAIVQARSIRLIVTNADEEG